MDKYAEDLYIAGQIIAEGFIDKLAEELEKEAKKIEIAGRKVDQKQYYRDLLQTAGLGKSIGLSDKEIEALIRKATSKKYQNKSLEEILGKRLRPRPFSKKPDITWIPREDNIREHYMVPSFYLKNK